MAKPAITVITIRCTSSRLNCCNHNFSDLTKVLVILFAYKDVTAEITLVYTSGVKHWCLHQHCKRSYLNAFASHFFVTLTSKPASHHFI